MLLWWTRENFDLGQRKMTIVFSIRLHFWSEPFIDSPISMSVLSAGPASWMCDPCGHTEPHAQKGIMLGWVLWTVIVKFWNNFVFEHVFCKWNLKEGGRRDGVRGISTAVLPVPSAYGCHDTPWAQISSGPTTSRCSRRHRVSTRYTFYIREWVSRSRNKPERPCFPLETEFVLAAERSSKILRNMNDSDGKEIFLLFYEDTEVEI